MISDKFSNCARPEIQEDVIFRGQKVRVAKEWKDYTDQEKANAINYKFGCGIDIVVFMLELERQFEASKAKIDTTADELGKRVTPEYIARVENSMEASVTTLKEQMEESILNLSERLRAIETKPAQIEADAAAAALPPDIEAR